MFALKSAILFVFYSLDGAHDIIYEVKLLGKRRAVASFKLIKLSTFLQYFTGRIIQIFFML